MNETSSPRRPAARKTAAPSGAKAARAAQAAASPTVTAAVEPAVSEAQAVAAPAAAVAAAPAAAPVAPAAAAPAAAPHVHAAVRSTVGQPQVRPEGYTQATALTESTDRLMHALQSRFTNGLSPASLMLAYLDWAVHLANSPGKATELVQNAAHKGARFGIYSLKALLSQDKPTEPVIEPLPQDTRFKSPEWQKFPFNVMHQSFLMTEQWWHYATTNMRGVSRHHQDVVSFTSRQLLDMFAPSNFAATNPDILKATIEQGGQNLVRGLQSFLEDMQSQVTGQGPAAPGGHEVGKEVAVTPGKVVYRNRLMELIQYSPTTDKVQAEPILIVPAWIMKYYILDLSPNNSMVKFLVEKGHTVFIISWKNPGPEDREMGMDDYRQLGVMAALDAISAIVPGQKIHTAGYCLGGTILSISAATMARDGDDRIASVTLLAAQTDFEEAGEIMLFIDESQVTYLEDMMWDQGVLDTKQMAGAFQLLRSNDLIWSQIIRKYMLGENDSLNDLMAWNADATRMPYRMHSQYLRRLFLNNDLSKGRFLVDGRPIALTDIRAPICAVGTTKDHVAPWKSVYKIGLLTDTDVTFVLASGGHNAGIVSEPGHRGRSYQAATSCQTDHFIDADTWQATTPKQEGSWWTFWEQWLTERSSGLIDAPQVGSPQAGYPALANAPGSYVMQK